MAGEEANQPGCPENAMPALSSMRVLLVDDSEFDAMLTIMALESVGIAGVTHAAGTTRALELVSTGNFHVLVTDYRMPGMSGVELVQAARAIQPGILTLILTGALPEEIRTQNADAITCLGKDELLGPSAGGKLIGALGISS